MDSRTLNKMSIRENNIFGNISNQFTFDASGINVDYLLFLRKDANSNLQGLKYDIEPLYQDILTRMGKFFEVCKLFSSDTQGVTPSESTDIIKYIMTTELPEISHELQKALKLYNFDYCANISSSYEIQVPINIKEQVNRFIEKINFLEKLNKEGHYYNIYKDRFISEKNRQGTNREDIIISIDDEKAILNSALIAFLNARNAINKDICAYIALWIHAYRFLQSRESCLEDSRNILCSHRFYGWTKPIYSLDSNFKIEFKTNFGYGDSNYFYLVIYYRGIQVFNFMDWVNYGFAEISEMEQYSMKYSIVDTSGKHSKEKIVDRLWEKAIQDAEDVCKCYLESEEEFVRVYIIENLESMVSRLEEVIDADDEEVNKEFRNYEYNFGKTLVDIDIDGEDEQEKARIVKAMSMNVKGYMISGLLNLMGEVVKLRDIIPIDSYLDRIKHLNLKLKPMLDQQVIINNDVRKVFNARIEENRITLVGMWLGTDTSEGLNELRKKNYKGELNGSRLINFKKLDATHAELSNKNDKLRQKVKNIDTLLSSIRRYQNIIVTFFHN